MAPSSTKPSDSLAVRWQQRSISAAGRPSPSRHSTIGWPSRVKGCGPSASAAAGMTGYQNRRNAGCWVTSIFEASSAAPELQDSRQGRVFGGQAFSGRAQCRVYRQPPKNWARGQSRKRRVARRKTACRRRHGSARRGAGDRMAGLGRHGRHDAAGAAGQARPAHRGRAAESDHRSGATAMIVIDMQNDFCAPEGWLARSGST